MKFDISYVCAAYLYAILCFISKFQKHNFSFLFYRVKESTSKIVINNISIMQQNLTWLDIWCHLIISYNVLICIKKIFILNKYANKDTCMYSKHLLSMKSHQFGVCVRNTKIFTFANVWIYCIIWANRYYFYVSVRLGQEVT